MKAIWKRPLSVILALVFVLGLMPGIVPFALAASNEKPNYTSAVSSYDDLSNRLNALISKYKGTYWTTDGKAAASSGATSKYYYGIQCKGFASYIFNDLFCQGYIGAYDSNKYYIPNAKGATLIGKAWNFGSSDVTTVKNILSQGSIGDYIQARRRDKSYGHTMIIAGVSDSGITIFDCNSDGKCGVKLYNQSWATFASKNSGMSLYHATNYPQEDIIERDETPPSISHVQVSDVTSEGYTVSCSVSDNVGISSVVFPTWTMGCGQDDLVRYEGTISGNTATCRIRTDAHNGEKNCWYYTDIYAYDIAGNEAYAGAGTTFVEDSPVLLADGDYVIRFAADENYVVDVIGGSMEDRANIRLYSYNGENAQIFHIRKDGTFYHFINKGSQMQMHVDQVNPGKGANVIQHIDTGSNGEKWICEDAGNGCVYIKSYLGTYLDVDSEIAKDCTNIQTWKFNQSDAQRFRLERVVPLVDVDEGIYAIRSAVDNSLALTVADGSKEDRANIQLNRYQGTDAQLFRITKNGDYYNLTNIGSEMQVHVHYGEPYKGVNIEQHIITGSIGQKWVFEDAGDGKVYIRSYVGTFMNEESAEVKDGANIQTWRGNEWDSEKFVLERVSSLQHALTFAPSGGTGNMENTTATDGQPFTLPECGFTAPDGQQFKAWKIGDKEYQPGDEYTFTEETTVMAVWEPITMIVCTVTFDSGNGTGKKEIVYASVGQPFTLPANSFSPLEGWAFGFWRIGDKEYHPGDVYTFTEDTTVTAVWKALIGGNGSTPAQLSATRTTTGLSVTVTPEDGLTYVSGYVAAYDVNGQMLGTAALTPNAGKQTLPLSCDSGKAETVKAFFLDQSARPVADALSGTVQ